MALQEDDPTREDPTRELTTAAGGDRCTNCQAPLASDQRYCVNCGERRGSARVAFAAMTSQAPPPTAPASAQPPHRPRAPSGINFIAGVATLLLAMGVGVLIGQGIGNNKATPTAASAPVNVKIVGGGGSGGGGGGSSSSGHAARRHHTNAPSVKLSKKVTKAVNNAAQNVLGSGAKNLAPATVQPGQSCSGGAGCQNHKFTGNFF